ncbi:MAG: cysteine desulfurase IscS [Oligoflexia bacterium]|nr:MAG: cysteine desulfurase IscS [Oligoflexia bacterium]
MQKDLYFDYCATTPVRPEVLQAMLPYFQDQFGNSMSLTHSYGQEAHKVAEASRKQIAELLGCQQKEVIFTSGATEANNWVLQGVITHLRQSNSLEPIHIISSPVEHNSILKCLDYLKKHLQVEVDFAPVNSYGQVEIDQIKTLIKPHTKLMSLMWVNNEIGTINPIREIASLCQEKGILFHTDATQAVGKIPLNLSEVPVDFLSFSGHKIYGPKGIGALITRKKLSPLIFGGGHEFGLRSGTLNIPGIVGLATALEISQQELSNNLRKFEKFREILLRKLENSQIKFHLNGHPSERAPHVLSLTFSGANLPTVIPGLAVSRGSACLSGCASQSHVLKAIGVSFADMANTIRFSLGSPTSPEDLEMALGILTKHLTKDINPRVET